MTARLTIDQVRVGDRVVCVDAHKDWLKVGATYEVKELWPDLIGLNVAPGVLWGLDRFIPAPAPPAPSAPGLTDVQATLQWEWLL